MNAEISIFLDTNILQSFGVGKGKEGSNVFLSNLGVPSKFYDLVSFIDENRLADKIEICVPEVVTMEMKYHMLSGFKSQRQKLNAAIEEHKKIFGDIAKFDAIEISYDEEQYEGYVDTLIKEFFANQKHHAKQVVFPRKEPIVDTLISKALSGVRPFFSGKFEGKSHSDAGFKDSLIAETIYQYHTANQNLCIFITNDQDFSREFSRKIQPGSELVLFTSIEIAIDALKEYYGTDPKKRLLHEFSENTYWHEFLLGEADVELDESVTDKRVESIEEDDEPNIFIIKMVFVVNEAQYVFTIRFDSIANEILSSSYQIEND